MALALLKRSDADLLLPVACDAPETLAAELSALQPFTVEVVAEWAGCAGKLPAIQSLMWQKLVRNGWFNCNEREARQQIDAFLKQDEAAGHNNSCEPKSLATPEIKCFDAQRGPEMAAHAEPKPRFQVDPSWHSYLEDCPRKQLPYYANTRNAR